MLFLKFLMKDFKIYPHEYKEMCYYTYTDIPMRVYPTDEGMFNKINIQVKQIN